MHIWYLSHYAGGPGIGRYSRAFHLARAWAEEGHLCTVILAGFHHLMDNPGSLSGQTFIDGIPYLALPTRPYRGNGPGRVLNMIDYCRSVRDLHSRVPVDLAKPDAIIVSSPHPFAIYPAVRLARLYGAALVFEVRDLWSLSIQQINGASWLHPFVLTCRHAEDFAYRRVDLVASLLANAEPHMRQRGLPPRRFVHVPNGVELNGPLQAQFPTSPTGHGAASQLVAWRNAGRIVIIHPGSQGVVNALDRLLDALSLLKSSPIEDRISVLLLGRGSQTEQLKAQVRRLQLSSVAFHDYVPKPEALWLIANSHVGYAGGRDHPDLYDHGNSFNKIVDFMQAGLPVILPLSTLGDPVTASGCGYVSGDRPTSIASAVSRIVEAGDSERQAMGDRGRRYVELNYDYRRLAATYADAIIQRRPRSA